MILKPMPTPTQRCSTWLADRFVFTVVGAHPQQFITQAAQKNIRLARITRTGDGFTMTARGADKHRLMELAAQGGWQISLVKRHGPGRWAERLLARPGVPLGAALFFVLVRLLAGFVWSIDFGAAETDTEQAALRSLLAENHIREGTYLSAEALAAAQQQATRQSERYGWVSLNFTGGCLFIERTPSQFQTIQPEPPPAALYAKAAGEVLSVEATSGFAAVAPGQYVAAGQLLVDCNRLSRTERLVTQGAAGSVVARVTKEYSASIPYTVAVPCLTGQSSTERTLCVLGRLQVSEPPASSDANAYTTTEWQPLHLGRVALPASICETTVWHSQSTTLHYSPAQAAALAARACRRALMEEFPTAVIEAQQRRDSATDAAHCTIVYTFRADIAAPPA